jgi:TonB family protein
MKISNFAIKNLGHQPIATNYVIQNSLAMVGFFTSTLRIFVFLLVLLCSITAHAQKSTYLNKYFFPISDTTKYKPKYYQQTYEKLDSLFISIYTLDHIIVKSKIISFDKDKMENNHTKLHVDSLGNLQGLTDFHVAKHSEYTVEYFPSGKIKSKQLSIDGKNLEGEYFDESGKPTPPPFEIPAIPYDGVAGWNMYLMSNLQFPTDAREKGQTGKVHVFFELDEKGKIQNPEIMNPEDISPSLGKEVLRVIKAYPHKWKPALKAGQPTRFSVKLPVGFYLP